MEKVMSVEERIRKAEEIYSRRNGQYINKVSNNKNQKRKQSSAKKLIMQIFICLIVYLSFYVFTNSDYIFSEQFLNQVKEIFNEDSKIYNIYFNIKSYIENNLLTNNEENVESNTQNEEESENNDESIGGAETVNEESKTEENLDEQAQMEKDAKEIKEKISFINPITGTISSTFGWRNPSTSTVPKYHTGLDIAAEKGTIIKSATTGVVTQVSTEGDYGNHYQIQTGDIIIVYAHCSKLYLKEGDNVGQGDEIAEVGSTGNSTGPHLHFEIRKDDELIDPQLILDI